MILITAIANGSLTERFRQGSISPATKLVKVQLGAGTSTRVKTETEDFRRTRKEAA